MYYSSIISKLYTYKAINFTNNKLNKLFTHPTVALKMSDVS